MASSAGVGLLGFSALALVIRRRRRN